MRTRVMTFARTAAIAAGFALTGLSANDAFAQGRTVWEGFHVGGHVGSGDFDFGISQTNPAVPLVTRDNGDGSFVGGIVYGSSWQFGNWVVGTDSAWAWPDASSGPNTTAGGVAATVDVEQTSSTRLRAGALIRPNLLLYGALGIAFADVDVSGPLLVNGGDDEKVFGVQYGGGLEAMFNHRWFARVEYLHTDYDDERFAEVGGGTFNVDLDSDVVRGAIGYRFDWSPLDLFTGR